MDETKEIDRELGISVSAMNSLATAMDWIADSLSSLVATKEGDGNADGYDCGVVDDHVM